MKLFAVAFVGLLCCTCNAQQFNQQDTEFKPSGLEKMNVASTTCTGFWRTPTFRCTDTPLPAYFAKANTGDQKALVIVSHGSGGLDKRHSDYANHLAANGINALVLGHWEARGLGKVHLDYNAARAKGGDGLNMAIDVLAASSQFKQLPEWRNTRLGYIGESMGGTAAFNVTRPFVETIVADALNRPVHNIDAVVSLYPGCIDRNVVESFKKIPLLIIAAEKDTETPVVTCVRHVDHMRARGANIEFMVLPGEHHDFDAPYKLAYSARAQNPAKCESINDGKNYTLLSTGKQYPATTEGVKEMRSACYTSGLWGGAQGSKVGYDIWTNYFLKKLF